MNEAAHRPDGAHALARWIRQPALWSLTVAAIGMLSLAGSLAVPIGIGSLVLALVGAVCVVAGLLTLGIILIGRLCGLDARSRNVVRNGRGRALLPGDLLGRRRQRRAAQSGISAPAQESIPITEGAPDASSVGASLR